MPRGTCYHEGCTNDAGHGFGWPGLRKDIPVKKRGILWSCDDAQHLAVAAERWRQATQRTGRLNDANDKGLVE
jgi:hypothetical protein